MNVAFVVDAFNSGNGGTAATMRLAEGLKKRGHTITIVAAKSVEQENFFQVRGFITRATEAAQKAMDMPWGIPEKDVLKKAFANVDIIQIQLPFYLGYGAAKIAKAMKKPFIGAFHVQPQNVVGAMGKESKFMEFLFFKTFNFFLYNRAPFIQCPSQFAADLLRANGGRRHLRVVSNGITAEYVPTEQDRPEWFGDKLVILNVGRQVLTKRQTLLIKSVKRSKYADKVLLLLCGKGEMCETLKQMAAELPVKPLIEYVSDEDKLKYLNTADLFGMPSIVELESLSCLEAIGCGLPCLVCDSPDSAASQFALDERFVFKFDDADSLAGKIDYWYEHRGELKDIRKQVLSMAERYRFETCLDKMEALYKEAIQSHNTGTR